MIVKLALRNYEIFNKLPQGSATLDQVKASSGGIDQYSKWTPPANYDGHDEIVQMHVNLQQLQDSSDRNFAPSKTKYSE
jgi:hypothetical protein